MNKFHGAWPALLTPHAADGGVDTVALRALVDYLLDQSVDGFYLCGSTGEGIYMPLADRQEVVETVVDAVDGRVPIIVHIGCVAVRDAIALAQHARQHDVDAISSIIPPFYRTVESAKAYFAAIANAVPELPLLPYIIGLPLDATALMRELLDIPSVAGTKYTGPNMYEFRAILEMGDGSRPHGWTVFSGMDEQCALAAMFGAHGNIGSTLNFMPGVYKAIHASVRRGDLAHARDLQLRANQVTRVALDAGYPGAQSEIMRLLGVECGDPRLPNLPLPMAQRAELRAQLEAVDFMELAQMAPAGTPAR